MAPFNDYIGDVHYQTQRVYDIMLEIKEKKIHYMKLVDYLIQIKYVYGNTDSNISILATSFRQTAVDKFKPYIPNIESLI